MKALITAASALALAALLPAAASAQTAPTSGTTFYGTLGYADTDLDHVNLGAIQGRLGARFGQYFGVEGEPGEGAMISHLASSSGRWPSQERDKAPLRPAWAS